MKVNGESIYGTQASPFKSLAWGRCTEKAKGGNTILYLHVFDWPADGRLVLPGIGNKPINAHLLSSPNQSLKVEDNESDLLISLPRTVPDKNCSVIALEIEGKPIIFDAPEIEAAADSFVKQISVTMKSSDKVEIRYTVDGGKPD